MHKDVQLYKCVKMVYPFMHQNNIHVLLLQIQIIVSFTCTFWLSLQGENSYLSATDRTIVCTKPEDR